MRHFFAIILGLFIVAALTVSPASAQATPELTVNDVLVAEGNSGTTTFTFTVSLNTATPSGFTVDYKTVDLTATNADNDYVSATGTLNFTGTAGAETKTFNVTVNGDTKVESSEKFYVQISSATVLVSDPIGFGTIANDDTASLTINDVTKSEGNSPSTTNFVFDVTLDKAVDGGFDVNYSTSNLTATAGSDYTANSGILNFTGTANETKSITVVVSGDDIVEANESFYVILFNPTNGGVNIDDNLGFGLINNDDSASLTIGDVSATAEGNAGTTNFVFTVSVDKAVAGGFTVDYKTSGGTATAGSDYTSADTTLTFGDLETSKTITIQVTGDTMVEPNETFDVVLSNDSHNDVTITDDTGTTTINNDDSATVSITAPSSTNEGNSGTTNFNFTVTTTALVQGGFTVNYSTANGTATAGSDYTAADTSVAFSGSDLSKTITIGVSGDTLVEGDEDFTVTLNSISGTSLSVTLTAPTSATGTIQNDDVANLTIDDVTATDEGDSGTKTFDFKVKLSATSSAPITVNYQTNDGTATTADSDYVAIGSTLLTFAAGESEKTVSVTVNGDGNFEPDETFTVTLSGASGATITDNSATGTIQNDDFVNVSINDATGSEAATPLSFTVTADKTIPGGFGLTYSTGAVGDTATGNTDYTSVASGSVTFGAADTTQPIDITIIPDNDVEDDETFTVTLAVAAGANSNYIKLTDKTGIGKITNDDAATVSIAATASATEGSGGGTTDLTFAVTLAGANVGSDFTIPFTITNGTTANADFGAMSGSVAFNSGAPYAPGASAPAVVKVSADSIVENNETFTITLGTPSLGGITVASGTGTGTITDNDTTEISLVASSVVESNSSATLNMQVKLTNPIAETLTITYSTSDVTATAGSDYTQETNATATISAGSLSGFLPVTVNGDTNIEYNETLTVTIPASGVSLPTISTTKITTTLPISETGTITNDDKVQISIADATPTTEGSGGGTTAYSFVVSAVGAGTYPEAITVDFASANGTATAGSDYTAVSGTGVTALSFSAAGTQTITVNVAADDIVEANESFTVALSNLSNTSLAAISDATGLGTINNDDTATLTITGNSQAEGDANNNMTFDVTLDKAVEGGFNISYQTVDGTAVKIQDYVFTSGSLNFTTATTKQITVPIIGDTVVEPDESFTIQLSNPVPASASASDITVSGSPATGTITNDDIASLSINDVTLAEGDSGTTAFNFTVTLNNDVTGGVKVDYTVNDVTTTAGTDYATVTPGTLTFTGTSGETKNITVNVNGDTTVETDETFNVVLSNVVGSSVTISDDTGVGTITNDDVASVTIEDVTQAEGDTGTTNFNFIATLNADVQGGFTVDANVSDGSATAADSDYTQATQPLTFAGTAGETQTYTVAVTGDTKIETDENFNVSLTNVSNSLVTISDTAVGTITNDDSATLTVEDVTIVEGADGSTAAMNFTVTIDNAVAGGFTVNYATGDGTATTADSDYAAANGTLTFTGTGGETQNFGVTIIGDDVMEANETFTIAFSNASDASVDFSDTASGIIVNDDNELLSNGSFEKAGVDPQLPESWEPGILSLSNDKLKCKDTGSIASDGLCAFKFQFFGTVAIISNPRYIRQKIDSPPLVAGDTLVFSIDTKAYNLVRRGKIVVKVTYVDGTVVKMDKILIDSGTYDYKTLTGSMTLTGTPAQIVVSIKARKTTGVFFVDNASLLLSATTLTLSDSGSSTRSAQPLELPSAPDNFRK